MNFSRHIGTTDLIASIEDLTSWKRFVEEDITKQKPRPISSL